MNFEDLSPELQAKVEACTTPEELMKLAKAEGLEIPDEQLQEIAGGSWGGSETPAKCPQCGSANINISIEGRTRVFICRECKHKWSR